MIRSTSTGPQRAEKLPGLATSKNLAGFESADFQEFAERLAEGSDREDGQQVDRRLSLTLPARMQSGVAAGALPPHSKKVPHDSAADEVIKNMLQSDHGAVTRSLRYSLAELLTEAW
jgi:hypothetical protein